MHFVRPGPQVFAHRGGCALGPENTMTAFELGLGAGADGLELDVHLSADGIPVVCHDELLDRTTDTVGPVGGLTAAELARVDAAARFVDTRGEFPFRGQGVGVPTLRAVLDRFREIPIIIEMKVDSAAMGEATAAVVRAAGAVDRVCAAGFGARSLRAARRALPQMVSSASQPEARLAVYRSILRWPVGKVPYQAYQVPEWAGAIHVVTPRFVRDAHAAGLAVQVWTVDDRDHMQRMLAWGVDALITNRPDLAVVVRNEFVAGTIGPSDRGK